MDEVFADPQVQHLGMAIPVTTKDGCDMRLIGQPIDLSRTPATISRLLAEPGCDNDDVLRELGIGEVEIEDLRRERVI
jgi:crotonobetainyl-CoA:carnitine CoA-transferase CaiB-like acyl-CoA transferase